MRLVQLKADSYRFTQAAAMGANVKSILDNDEIKFKVLNF
jgi:hypothetical protein